MATTVTGDILPQAWLWIHGGGLPMDLVWRRRLPDAAAAATSMASPASPKELRAVSRSSRPR
ncbi:hypothetical protein BDA96_06G192100 [Sorghum bicolor]|uniref:Uncharacterized protein n=2 Tax=Sorghum bicolor TaxID=4558 RepID=A0A921QTF2_SORBI|nr:hypothetical protein SORBI_3006G175600 [Sorghum bicolor]KAG0526970.1 hypothetical protein BDA96_06G192100 [Sorghum bicolor]